MAKKEKETFEIYNYLKSDLASSRFAFAGQLGEASKAIAPVFQAFETTDAQHLSIRMSKTFRHQMETELEQLKKANLKRVIRITEAKLESMQNKGGRGFTRWIDASREWRECEIEAAVLEQYIDTTTGECVIENFDEAALLVLRQSRHVKASDNKKSEVYVREHYICPSCGAELEHIADQTNCHYCGAYIRFNFFDWQLDSFSLNMHKESLLLELKKNVAATAEKTAEGGVTVVLKAINFLAELMVPDRDDSSPSDDYMTYIGLVLTFFILFLCLLGIMFLALPIWVQILIGLLVAFLIVRGIRKFLKRTDQKRKKKKIVRYSDGYLRSCVYDIIWNDMDITGMIDFSIDGIVIKTLKNTETTTTIDVLAEVIKKYISKENGIHILEEDVPLKLQRARYPERIKNKGAVMVEKECPSCGANFEPDKSHCCSYCGYGLKMENYVWKQVQ